MRKKAVVLIPLTYNDGSRVSKKTLNAIYNEILFAFHGWTIEGKVQGAYRMATGAKRVEWHMRVAIVLDEAEIGLLRRMVGKWCTRLGQETMLLEVTVHTAGSK